MNNNDKFTMIHAVYKQQIGEGTFHDTFFIPFIETNGKDCDNPEILEKCIEKLIATMIDHARNFHIAGRVPGPIPFPDGTRVLAFYTNQRSKALIDRFSDPIVLNSSEHGRREYAVRNTDVFGHHENS